MLIASSLAKQFGNVRSMDVAPRSAFLAAIVLPQERTVVIGLINVAKTTALSLGPLITGLLADSNFFWVSFIMAGALKASYDLGFLGLFKNHERVEARRSHQDQEEGTQE
ncbi:multidrug resistance [Fusarium albosuccineum]|uniref:Multidrug resistance n=1 Tax=Fusarium albosuccineum TaxID=1237068 RepID=A0A8H4L596_9HYPO|nr:multidrug resistance [Fusarium albosuccineum]